MVKVCLRRKRDNSEKSIDVLQMKKTGHTDVQEDELQDTTIE